MNAGRFYGGKNIRVETVADPEPGEGQVLVSVKATGICGSDLHGYHAAPPRKHPPRIQGHEMAGEVIALGPGVSARRVGERVAIEPLMPCLSCDYCLQGHYQICRSLEHRAGGFAEMLVATERNAHPLPDDLAFDHGAMAEVYAVAVHALTRVPVEPGERVAVIGSGPIGLTIAEMAKLSGAGSVMVVGRTAPPLETIEAMIGARTVDIDQADAEEAVAEWTGGRGADVVFEAVGGFAETLKQAMKLARPGGRVGMVGAQFAASDLPMGYAQCRELSLHGVFCYGRRGVRSEFGIAIELLSQGRLDPESLITHRFPLRQLARAFETADQRVETGSIKVIVNP